VTNPTTRTAALIWFNSEKGKVCVSCPFNAGFNMKTNGLTGRRWYAEKRIWEFSADPETIDKLVGLLFTCYGRVHRPPFEWFEILEKLNEDDVEAVYRVIARKMTGEDRVKLDKFFSKYINIAKAMSKAARRMIQTEPQKILPESRPLRRMIQA
jgi:hypothetical protein